MPPKKCLKKTDKADDNANTKTASQPRVQGRKKIESSNLRRKVEAQICLTEKRREKRRLEIGN